MKHAHIHQEQQIDWSLSDVFWMRSAGFPVAWLETCSYTGDTHDGLAIAEWFSDQRVGLLRDFVDYIKDDLLSEAIGISNPDALDRISKLADADLAKINSRARQRLRLYWMYMQRLCAKNDTCSFFGPISWGGVAQDGEPDRFDVVDPRPDANRRIFFEHWFVQRVADKLSDDVRNILPLRLNPGVRIEGHCMYVPVDRAVKLKPAYCNLLSQLQTCQDSDAPLRLVDTDDDTFLKK